MKKYMSLDYILGGFFIFTPLILILLSSGDFGISGKVVYMGLMGISSILMIILGYRGRNLPFIFLGLVLFALAVTSGEGAVLLHGMLFYVFFLGYAIYILLLSRLTNFIVNMLQLLLLVVLVVLSGFDFIYIFDAEVLGLVVIGQHYLYELEK